MGECGSAAAACVGCETREWGMGNDSDVAVRRGANGDAPCGAARASFFGGYTFGGGLARSAAWIR